MEEVQVKRGGAEVRKYGWGLAKIGANNKGMRGGKWAG